MNTVKNVALGADPKTKDRINKVTELINRGATEGEQAAAREALNRIKEAHPEVLVIEIKKYLHDELRPHQSSVLEQVKQSKKPYIVTEAPTGFGKSFVPAQLAHEGHKVMVLTRAKSLQDQYGGPPYFADVVKGKATYGCEYNGLKSADLCKIEPKKDIDTCFCTRDDCTTYCKESSELKGKCLSGCPYPVACQTMLASNLGSLNYAKYLTEIRPNGLVGKYGAEYLFLDECHQLSDLTIEYSGCSLSYELHGKPNEFLLSFTKPLELNPLLPLALRINKAVDWLDNLFAALMKREPKKPNKLSTENEIKYYKKWDILTRKIGTTIDMVDEGREYWYAESNAEKGFRLKPLTARFHFRYLFKAPKIVMMSATVGNPAPFMAELGIYEDFESIVVPNIWPPSTRPIVDLHGPKMNYRNTPMQLEEHAQVIAEALNECDPAWTGIIHTNSKAKANSLCNRLRSLTKRPLWLPPMDVGTEEVLAQWKAYKQHNRGAIALAWNLVEGVDLGDDQISIVAWLSWPDFSDQYEKERFDFDPKAGLGRVANHLVQALGRVRRGRPQDYEPGNNFVALVDANWSRLKSSINSSILESVA